MVVGEEGFGNGDVFVECSWGRLVMVDEWWKEESGKKGNGEGVGEGLMMVVEGVVKDIEVDGVV